MSIADKERIDSAMVDTVRLLIVREWRRVLMEPARLMGVLVQPLLFLVVFGSGFHKSFVLESYHASYLVFFFPGILGLVLLFSSIYATMTLVEDKKCGFFRLVLYGPGGIVAAVVGKVLATAALGFIQGLCFFSLIFILPLSVTGPMLLWSTVVLFLASLLFSVMGVLCAWLSPSGSAFHAVMSVLLLPMWLLSGAMFPLNGVLYVISFINPMAYVVSALRDNFLAMGPSWFDALAIVFFMIFFVYLLLISIKHRSIE